MVRAGYNLIIIGGRDVNDNGSGSLLKLSCANQSCQWETLTQELNIPRYFHATVTIPNEFIQCN